MHGPGEVGLIRTLCAALVVLGLAGCATTRYYWQAITGQMALLAARVPVERVVANPATGDALKEKLELAEDVLAFAGSALSLPVGDRYRTFVSLEREHVLWNVVAAPEFSVAPLEWCYPVVGCASYRGYFHRQAAERFARRLARRGHDVVLAGVDAYSTLGWFDDPLLSTFMTRADPDLAALIIHELAHSRVFIAGDTAFNEAFATFVEQAGVRRWLDGRPQALAAYEHGLDARRRFANLLLVWRDALAGLYALPLDPTALRPLKAAAFDGLRECAASLPLLADGRYAQFFEGPINNAHLVSVSAYHRWVPAFAVLWLRQDGDWPAFYRAAEALGELGAVERTVRLDALADQQVAERGNDDHADHIQCQPFTYHTIDGYPAGGEHDQVRGRGHRQHEGAARRQGRRDHQ